MSVHDGHDVLFYDLFSDIQFFCLITLFRGAPVPLVLQILTGKLLIWNEEALFFIYQEVTWLITMLIMFYSVIYSEIYNFGLNNPFLRGPGPVGIIYLT